MLAASINRGFRFTLKSSFKGDTDIAVDIDMDVDSDMAVSVNWGSSKRNCWAPLKVFGLDMRQV